MRKKDKERSTENNIGQIRIDYTLPVVKIWEIYLNNPEKNFFYLKDYAEKSGHGLKLFFYFLRTQLSTMQRKHRSELLEIVKPKFAGFFEKIETSADMRKQIEKFLLAHSKEIVAAVWEQPCVIQLMKKGLQEDDWGLNFKFFVSVLRTQRFEIFYLIWHKEDNDLENKLSLSIFLNTIPQTAENDEKIFIAASLSGSLQVLNWICSLRPSLHTHIQQTLESPTIALEKKIFFSEELFVLVKTSSWTENKMPAFLSNFFKNVQDISFFESLRKVYESNSKKKYTSLIIPYLDKKLATLRDGESSCHVLAEPKLSAPVNVTTVPDFSFFSPGPEVRRFLFEIPDDMAVSDTLYTFS